ncbi:hypothetical protein [Aurantimonas sp. Leaf443]|uniref:hypothetical protein n=1 Tax=Aurantimonas sp. Leaf443 TaxID=1736378 RepID=UPI0012E3F8DF|nr:hypothetical protein [Aurantimonas sp. Leaf443]
MSSSSEIQGDLPTMQALLLSLAHEVAAQARSVESLHDLATGSNAAQALRLGQTVDIASQHLLALASVLESLAASTRAETDLPLRLVHTLEALPLSALRDRLLARVPVAANDDDDSGDMELL